MEGHQTLAGSSVITRSVPARHPLGPLGTTHPPNIPLSSINASEAPTPLTAYPATLYPPNTRSSCTQHLLGTRSVPARYARHPAKVPPSHPPSHPQMNTREINDRTNDRQPTERKHDRANDLI